MPAVNLMTVMMIVTPGVTTTYYVPGALRTLLSPCSSPLRQEILAPSTGEEAGSGRVNIAAQLCSKWRWHLALNPGLSDLAVSGLRVTIP